MTEINEEERMQWRTAEVFSALTAISQRFTEVAAGRNVIDRRTVSFLKKQLEGFQRDISLYSPASQAEINTIINRLLTTINNSQLPVQEDDPPN